MFAGYLEVKEYKGEKVLEGRKSTETGKRGRLDRFNYEDVWKEIMNLHDEEKFLEIEKYEKHLKSVFDAFKEAKNVFFNQFINLCIAIRNKEELKKSEFDSEERKIRRAHQEFITDAITDLLQIEDNSEKDKQNHFDKIINSALFYKVLQSYDNVVASLVKIEKEVDRVDLMYEQKLELISNLDKLQKDFLVKEKDSGLVKYFKNKYELDLKGKIDAYVKKFYQEEKINKFTQTCLRCSKITF